jgi:hypothetical protein
MPSLGDAALVNAEGQESPDLENRLTSRLRPL